MIGGGNSVMTREEYGTLMPHLDEDAVDRHYGAYVEKMRPPPEPEPEEISEPVPISSFEQTEEIQPLSFEGRGFAHQPNGHEQSGLPDHTHLYARVAALEERFPQVTQLVADLQQHAEVIRQLGAAYTELYNRASASDDQAERNIRATALDLAIKAIAGQNGGITGAEGLTTLADVFAEWLRGNGKQPDLN